MKKIIIIAICLCNVLFVSGEKEKDAVEIKLLQNAEIIKIEFRINDFKLEEQNIDGKNFYKVIIDGEANLMEKGYPSLPKICRSIIIPDDKKMGIKVVKARYKEYEDLSIIPSKGIILRTINPDDIPYEFGDIYDKDEWYPGKLAELKEPYILRDFRGQVVEIYPFQYNAFQKKLRVYDDIIIEIYPIGKGEKNVYYRNKPIKIDPNFYLIYKRHFINYDENRYTPVDEEGNMLIICYDDFYSTMLPFVEWKNMKGIPTEIVNLSEVGDSASDIKNYIANYYNTYGLTFVLLVGDVQQIPTLYSGGYASDTSYSYIVGDDHYPDLFVGRFSAQTTEQLETQVQRSINYEKYPTTADWYHNGTGIASNEGPGDDGEYDWEHMRNIRNDLLAYTYTKVDEFYDGSHGGEDEDGNPTDTMVANAINNGRSIINYCGHGSWDRWITSNFDINDVNNLVNDNMLPFICSVACNNGEFDNYDTCFAEAWLRATHNGNATGAIAAFMSSGPQYWSPPMDAQDEMVDILVETYPNNIKRTIGAISYNGCMHMNDEYGQSGYDMTDRWVLFGDPSLQVRTDTPTNMTVLHSSFISIGQTSFEVTVVGIEKALCALSLNGKLISYNYTNENGETILYFEPFYEPCYLDFVVTAYNKIPYITKIPVIGGEHNITLKAGWNLITIPFKNNWTAKTLGENITNCSIIAKWNATMQQFQSYLVGISPDIFDFEIEDGKGYFVYVLNNTLLHIEGIEISNVSVPLHIGWNLIGWFKNETTTASSLGQNITNCSIISKWNASLQQYESYLVGTSPTKFDFKIERGMGIFIYTNEESIWHGEG